MSYESHNLELASSSVLGWEAIYDGELQVGA